MKQLMRDLALALAGVTLIGAPLFVRAVSQEMEPPVVLAKATVNPTEAPAERIGETPVRCRDCHDARPTVPTSPRRQSPPFSDNRENTHEADRQNP